MTSAGFIALLDESEPQLRTYALEQLNAVMAQYWAEIAHVIGKIESLWKDESFVSRQLAALVVSKVYYHLEEYSLSMRYALHATSLFNVNDRSEYVQTLVAKCIDEYICQRQAASEEAPIAHDLEAVVNKMFDRCFADGQYRQAMGIALEARRMDMVQKAISASGDVEGMLSYCFDVSMKLVNDRDFRQTVLRELAQQHAQLESPNHNHVMQIYMHLHDPTSVGKLLVSLVNEGAEASHLMAYQLAFDLVQNASQRFVTSVRAVVGTGSGDAEADSVDARLAQIGTILSGEVSVNLFLEFLAYNDSTDREILVNIKDAVEPRNTVCHTATIFANAIMHAGTTRDTFLRENLDWLSRATNWAKFSATAGLGVIHKGHLKKSMTLLRPYLPEAGGSPYSQGGALYALGLIHANHGSSVLDYLTAASTAAHDETIQHGACLGLGLAAMATGNAELYEDLKSRVLYVDNAVSGEAAGLSMGMVLMGQAHEKALEEMLAYAHATAHEKIIRGLAMGMALIMYGREAEADALIEQLCSDKDPILRYGGMYTVGLAYAGTGNNAAIRRLLHVAVSDVSDDVRRAAVINIGFLLFQTPEQTPILLTLLSKSYNAHVRYGAALAVGISCAGTGMKEAVALLDPLVKDQVDFVRQGANVAMAMVLIQASEAVQPKVKEFREHLATKITTKRVAVMSKFGCILASGIIDAGGRNVTISPRSFSGHRNASAVVGLALFTQYWYWYPFIHFVSLAFTPTAIIGLNKSLEMPRFSFTSNAKPSMYAYPAKVKPPETKKAEKVSTAVLSITKKAAQRQRRKEAAGQHALASASSDALLKSMDTTADEAADEPEPTPEPEPEPEPESQTLSNPARVTWPQLSVITFDADPRYKPLTHTAGSTGIVMLHDKTPDVPTALASLKPKQEADASAKEPSPPADFDFDFDA